MTTQTTRTRPQKRAAAPSKLAIKDVMTKQPHTIGRDQTLELAHQMMIKHRIRHLPVLERGRLVGILTQRDLYFLETIAGVDISEDIVEDAMSPDIYVVRSDERVEDVAAAMAKRKLGSAVVVEHDRVIGIFTVTDALRILAGKSH
jgi:acetoin utilization protein AcuB